MQQLYLSRKNLMTLLEKLDRVKAGGNSQCTIIKHDIMHPKYPCSDQITVTAVEDEDYYSDRKSGVTLEDLNQNKTQTVAIIGAPLSDAGLEAARLIAFMSREN